MHSRSSPRRRHSAEFKAEVLAACEQPGASVSAVALAHGLNANLVHKWRMAGGVERAKVAAPVSLPMAAAATPASSALAADARFVPIEIATPAKATPSGIAHRGEAVIHVELKRGATSVLVRWPSSAGTACAAWLRELAVGLLK